MTRSTPSRPLPTNDRDDVPARTTRRVLKDAVSRRAEHQAVARTQVVHLGAFSERETAVEHPDLLVNECVDRSRKDDARAWRKFDLHKLQQRVARRRERPPLVAGFRIPPPGLVD